MAIITQRWLSIAGLEYQSVKSQSRPPFGQEKGIDVPLSAHHLLEFPTWVVTLCLKLGTFLWGTDLIKTTRNAHIWQPQLFFFGDKRDLLLLLWSKMRRWPLGHPPSLSGASALNGNAVPKLCQLCQLCHALCQEQKYDNATLARKLKAKQAGEGMAMVRLAISTQMVL